MISIRDRNARGPTKIDWLESQHSFSFGSYYDPDHMGFGPLRVLNEDKVIPGAGFGRHPHRDMEIVSYVLEGALAHQDSMGNGSIIKPGDIQRMSAGTGVTHSEYNASQTNPVHFLQIWFLPEKAGLVPSYDQRPIDPRESHNRFTLAMSQEGREGTITINQDIDFYVARLDGQKDVAFEARPNRLLWVQVARGSVVLNDYSLQAGDGAAISHSENVSFSQAAEAEILLFDMPDLHLNAS